MHTCILQVRPQSQEKESLRRLQQLAQSCEHQVPQLGTYDQFPGRWYSVRSFVILYEQTYIETLYIFPRNVLIHFINNIVIYERAHNIVIYERVHNIVIYERADKNKHTSIKGIYLLSRYNLILCSSFPPSVKIIFHK